MATQHEWVVKRGNGADYVWRTATGWSTARADALRMSFEDARTLKLRLGELDIWSKLTVAYESAAQAPEETPPDWVVMRMLDGVKTWKRVWTGDQTRWTRHLSEAARSRKETAEYEAAMAACGTPGSVVAVPLTAEVLAAAKAQAESTAVPKDPEWVVKRTLDGLSLWAMLKGGSIGLWVDAQRDATRMSEHLAKGLAANAAETTCASVVAIPWEEAGGAAPTAIKSTGDLTAPLPTVLTEDMLVEACAAAMWEASEAQRCGIQLANGIARTHQPWATEVASQDFARKLVRGMLGVAPAAGPEHDETVRNAVFSVAKALGWTPPAQVDDARRDAWSTYDGVVRGLQEIREQDTATPAAEPADWMVQGEWRGGPIYWHGWTKGWLTTPDGAIRLPQSTAERMAKRASEEGRPAKAVPWEAPAEEKAEWLIRETERGYYLHGKFMPGFHGWNSDRQMAAKFTHTEATRIASLIVNPTEVVRQAQGSEQTPTGAEWPAKVIAEADAKIAGLSGSGTMADQPEEWLLTFGDGEGSQHWVVDQGDGPLWSADKSKATRFTRFTARLFLLDLRASGFKWAISIEKAPSVPPRAVPADWAVKSSSGKPYLVVTGRFSVEWDDDGARATKLTRADAEDLAMRLNSERAERGLESVVWIVPWPGAAKAPAAA